MGLRVFIIVMISSLTCRACTARVMVLGLSVSLSVYNIYIYSYPEENQVASYIQEKEFDLWLHD